MHKNPTSVVEWNFNFDGTVGEFKSEEKTNKLKR